MARGIASRWGQVVLPRCCLLLFWAPQCKTDTAILERTPSPVPPQGPSHFPLASECWALGANGHQRQQDGAVLARSSAGRRQALAPQRCPAATTTSTPLPILAVAVRAVSLRHGEGPPVPGGMGQANCCCGSREALTDIEPVLSADVRLRRGPASPPSPALAPGQGQPGPSPRPRDPGAGCTHVRPSGRWGTGLCPGVPKEATSSPPPASPLCRGGTSLRPQLRLALDQLWVLSGGKEAAGEEEEEAGSDEDRTTLIFIWPTGSCIADFGSRALKELWVGTLLGTPEGAKRARVTRLPSLKLLEKELSRRHAWRTVSVRSLERLMEGQAEADPKQGPPPVPAGNGGGLCRSPGEFWKERQLLASG
ncbi:uncharacterized protein J5F26_003072 [Ciconia maguari]